jgi:hypothetical protein
MKVIFLDIDGVLNCDKTPNPRKFPYIVDKKLLVRLKKLLDRTGAKVVLSSTWRCDPVGLFAAKHWGVPFIDVCPDKPRSSRCREITSWLADLEGPACDTDFENNFGDPLTDTPATLLLSFTNGRDMLGQLGQLGHLAGTSWDTGH